MRLINIIYQPQTFTFNAYLFICVFEKELVS